MPHPNATAVPDWADRLRARGLRATTGRVAALEFFRTEPHSSVADAYGALKGDFPHISYQSLNNIVRDLSTCGLLRRIGMPDSSSAQYETRVGDNHHHIQCLVCGRVEDVDCVVGEAPCLTPSDNHGMRLVEASVVFRGICAECDHNPDRETKHR